MPKAHKPSENVKLKKCLVAMPRESRRAVLLDPARDGWEPFRSVRKNEEDRHFSPEGYEALKEYEREG